MFGVLWLGRAPILNVWVPLAIVLALLVVLVSLMFTLIWIFAGTLVWLALGLPLGLSVLLAFLSYALVLVFWAALSAAVTK